MKKRFKKVYIEITNICNLDCSFCKKTKRQPKSMNLCEYEYVLNKIKDYTDYIYLHLLGEPLLHPNLVKFIELANNLNLKVSITTNGTLVNNVKDDLLDLKLYKISFSLHSFEASTNKINMIKYIQDICSFSKEISQKQGTICVLRLWNIDSDGITTQNLLNDNIIDIIENTFNKKGCISKSLLHKNNIKLIDNVYIETAEKFAWPSMDIKVISRVGFCYGLRDQIAVQSDGTVVPCCLDTEADICLGNIFEQDLNLILNSERAKNIYNGFSNKKAVEPLCQRCGFAKRFKR